MGALGRKGRITANLEDSSVSAEDTQPNAR
jgi:hypothetical protein